MHMICPSIPASTELAEFLQRGRIPCNGLFAIAELLVSLLSNVTFENKIQSGPLLKICINMRPLNIM